MGNSANSEASGQRRQQGNMLVLVALVVTMIIAVGLIGLVFYSLIFQHERSQYYVDSLAIDLAPKINVDDRVGQMNQLEGRNRELVFQSRERCNKINEQGLRFLQPMADQLLMEARDGHALVEAERRNQIYLIVQDVREAVHAYNKARNDRSNFIFSWLKTYEPDVLRVDLGSVNKVQSNVESLQFVEELAVWDRKQNFVEGGSNLYKGGIDARLPFPDTELEYQICSLPARIEGTYAPVRIINAEAFRRLATIIDGGKAVPYRLDQIPSAIQVFTKMEVAVDEDPAKRTAVRVASSAATGGATADPR